MNAKTVFTFFGGVVVGLILGVWLFSGSSPQVSRGPGPAPAPQQQQVDVMRLQKEIDQLEKLVASDAQNYQAWKKLGDSLFDIGEHGRSIEAYRTALAIDDSDPNVWTDMGVMYRRTNNPVKAIESFDAAIARNQNHTVALLNKGVVYVNDLGDLEKGVAAWEKFLQVQPSGPQSDGVRQEIERARQMMGAKQGAVDLPADHPEIPSTSAPGGAAPSPGGAAAPADPSSYFPKPDQQ